MKSYIKLAWRNIWRNKRRTIITSSSVLFAITIALLTRSFQLGSYDNMIKNVIKSYTGYLQIQSKDYWDDQTIDNSFELDNELLKKIQSVENISTVVPRIESFALASTGEKTKGVFLMAIKPKIETSITKLEHKLVRFRVTENSLKKIEKSSLENSIKEKLIKLDGNGYSNLQRLSSDLEIDYMDNKELLEKIGELIKFKSKYLSKNDNGVLVSYNLAKFINIDVGDTLSLLSNGYHGASAADNFPVRGLLKFPSPKLDSRMVYITLPQAQNFFSAENHITSIAIDLKKTSDKNLEKTISHLQSNIDTKKFSIKSWKELNKELVQQIESDNSSGKIMLGMIYMIIAFGIFGTILMMTAERKREFGVMVAIGMQKFKLSIIITIELLFITMIGTILGIISSIPIVLWGYYKPIRLTGEMAEMIESFGIEPVMPMAWFGDYYYNQVIVILILVLISMIYPAITISRLNVIKSMRD